MSSTSEKARSSTISAVTLTKMSEHDLLEVVEIEERSGLSRWGWSAYYAELQSPLAQMFVARINRPLQHDEAPNLAGYIVARVSAGELHVNNVAVRDEFRGQGIGSALLAMALREGSRIGAERAFLEVRSGNVAAQALYSNSGFALIGRRPGYYSDPVEDALIMSVELQRDA
jgi:ribosomal-protein-alanine N-acetyltransferase